MSAARRSRYAFSIRWLLLVTAAVACLLVPVVWVERARYQMQAAQREILLAREAALRSLVREQLYRVREDTPPARAEEPASATLAAVTGEVEALRRENAALKQEIQALRRTLEDYRTLAKQTDHTGP